MFKIKLTKKSITLLNGNEILELPEGSQIELVAVQGRNSHFNNYIGEVIERVTYEDDFTHFKVIKHAKRTIGSNNWRLADYTGFMFMLIKNSNNEI